MNISNKPDTDQMEGVTAREAKRKASETKDQEAKRSTQRPAKMVVTSGMTLGDLGFEFCKLTKKVSLEVAIPRSERDLANSHIEQS